LVRKKLADLQIRIEQHELADASGLSLETIKRIERTPGRYPGIVFNAMATRGSSSYRLAAHIANSR
jgi:hypothetical protein